MIWLARTISMLKAHARSPKRHGGLLLLFWNSSSILIGQFSEFSSVQISKQQAMSFRWTWAFKAENTRYSAVGSRCVRTSNLEISCRHLADYVKEMYLRECCAGSAIVFPHLTNNVLDLWYFRCRSRCRFFNSLRNQSEHLIAHNSQLSIVNGQIWVSMGNFLRSIGQAALMVILKTKMNYWTLNRMFTI